MPAFFAYDFMIYAILTIALLAPVYAILGTMVIDSRMSFFSEALGHSALTGVALGIALGMQNATVAAVIFGILFGLAINQVKKKGKASSDTIISVFSSAAIALGLVLLSRGGNFAKYSSVLVGDIMSVTKGELLTLCAAVVMILALCAVFYNRLLLVNVNPSIAKSRHLPVELLENIFMIMVAALVTLSITRVGTLLVNSLLVLPAATSRNLAKNTAQYHLFAVLIGLFSGLGGVIVAFYGNITTGGTIVLINAILYFASLLFTRK